MGTTMKVIALNFNSDAALRGLALLWNSVNEWIMGTPLAYVVIFYYAMSDPDRHSEN
jgi:hypothetical protein